MPANLRWQGSSWRVPNRRKQRSLRPVTPVTEPCSAGVQTIFMPILFMALIALAVFLVMGGMVFYAAYAESRTAHPDDAARPGPRG